jgi:glycosyltransferase involved in cell wall biosynthesis
VKKQQRTEVIWTVSVEKVLSLVDPLYMFHKYNVDWYELTQFPPQQIYSKGLISELETIVSSQFEVVKQDFISQSVILPISFLCSIEIEQSIVGKGTIQYVVKGFSADWFDSIKYSKRYSDVYISGIDPLYHFLVHGYLEGRYPDCRYHPRFANLKSMRAVYESAGPSYESEEKFGIQVSWTESYFNIGHHSDFAIAAESTASSPKSDLNSELVGLDFALERDEHVPAVSFVIPCYMQSRFLPDLLLSIGDSTTLPHECLIVNDGNPNESENRLINSQKPMRTHQTVKIISTRNKGLASARNVGLKYATGKYVKFIDSDDLLVVDSVDKQIEIVESKNLDACIGGYMFFGVGFGKATQVIDVFVDFRKEKFFCEDFLTRNFFFDNWEEGLTIPIHSLLIKREATPYFDESYRSKEDLEYWLRLLSSGAKIEAHFDYVAIYRMHKDQMSRRSKIFNGFYLWKILGGYMQSENPSHVQDIVSRKTEYLDRFYGEGARDLFEIHNNSKASVLSKDRSL